MDSILNQGFPFDGAIDPSTVNNNTVFLIRIADTSNPTTFNPQIVGINQVVWDTLTNTLFVKSDQQLDQHTTYLLIVTKGVHDSAGDPIEADDSFVNFRHTLNFGQTKDPELKSYRKTLIDFLDADVLATLAPDLLSTDIAVASVFTTGSVTSTLEKIRDQIKVASAPTASFNLGTHGESTVFPIASISGILFGQQQNVVGSLNTVPVPTPALQVFPGAVAKVAFGKFSAKNFETPGGFIPVVPTRTGVPAVQSTGDVYFNLFIPAGTRPANGWPVAIFAHGLGNNKNSSPFAVASTLAHNGIATLSINSVGHGFGPAGILTVIQGSGSVVLSAGGRGVDLNASGTIDSFEGLLATGAQFDITGRDGVQQTVADLMQVVRMIQGGVDVDNTGSASLDANRIYMFGQSSGGIIGTVFMGIEPDIKAGVPVVPGGPSVDAALFSESNRLLLTAFLGSRLPSLLNGGVGGFTDNTPLRNQAPVINLVPGAMEIQRIADVFNWIAQAGESTAWAPFIRKSPLPGQAAKAVIIQFARGDKTNPNPSTTAIIRAGDLADCATFFRNDLAFLSNLGFPKNPHTFLTNIAGTPAVAAVAIGAQTQIEVFFASNGALTIDPDGSRPTI